MSKRLTIIYFCVVALIVASCSYKPEFRRKPCNLKYGFEGLMGTQVIISAVPDDDNTLYYFNVISKPELESLYKEYGSMEPLTRITMQEYREYYGLLIDLLPKGTTYKLSMEDTWYMGPSPHIVFVNLSPQTDYYVYSVFLDPVTKDAMGEAQLCPFRTTQIDTTLRPMQLDFMVRDSKGSFMYYVRPTYNGRLKRDLYVADIIPTEEIMAAPYYGSLWLYSRVWYDLVKEKIASYLHSDISRIYSDIDMEEGKSYTVMAAPFNISDSNPIYHYTFTYKADMKTDYVEGDPGEFIK